VAATDAGFVNLRSGDELKLMEAVAKVGPVSVAIDASQSSFRLYDAGTRDYRVVQKVSPTEYQ